MSMPTTPHWVLTSCSLTATERQATAISPYHRVAHGLTWYSYRMPVLLPICGTYSMSRLPQVLHVKPVLRQTAPLPHGPDVRAQPHLQPRPAHRQVYLLSISQQSDSISSAKV